MSSLSELYQQVIIDHYKSPHNHRVLEPADRTAEGHNPLCGDRVTVYLNVVDGTITDAAFQGQGCAISKASASVMTDAIKGHTLEEAEALFERFHGLVTRDPGVPVDEERLGKLAVFSGVSQFPARVKCAVLAWHTLKAALDQPGTRVSTE